MDQTKLSIDLLVKHAAKSSKDEQDDKKKGKKKQKQEQGFFSKLPIATPALLGLGGLGAGAHRLSQWILPDEDVDIIDNVARRAAMGTQPNQTDLSRYASIMAPLAGLRPLGTTVAQAMPELRRDANIVAALGMSPDDQLHNDVRALQTAEHYRMFQDGAVPAYQHLLEDSGGTSPEDLHHYEDYIARKLEETYGKPDTPSWLKPSDITPLTVSKDVQQKWLDDYSQAFTPEEWVARQQREAGGKGYPAAVPKYVAGAEQAKNVQRMVRALGYTAGGAAAGGLGGRFLGSALSSGLDEDARRRAKLVGTIGGTGLGAAGGYLLQDPQGREAIQRMVAPVGARAAQLKDTILNKLSPYIKKITSKGDGLMSKLPPEAMAILQVMNKGSAAEDPFAAPHPLDKQASFLGSAFGWGTKALGSAAGKGLTSSAKLTTSAPAKAVGWLGKNIVQGNELEGLMGARTLITGHTPNFVTDMATGLGFDVLRPWLKRGLRSVDKSITANNPDWAKSGVRSGLKNTQQFVTRHSKLVPAAQVAGGLQELNVGFNFTNPGRTMELADQRVEDAKQQTVHELANKLGWKDVETMSTDMQQFQPLMRAGRMLATGATSGMNFVRSPLVRDRLSKLPDSYIDALQNEAVHRYGPQFLDRTRFNQEALLDQMYRQIKQQADGLI